MKTEDFNLKEMAAYTDQEINAVAEFYQELTFPQLVYLKESYEAMVKIQASLIQSGNAYTQ